MVIYALPLWPIHLNVLRERKVSCLNVGQNQSAIRALSSCKSLVGLGPIGVCTDFTSFRTSKIADLNELFQTSESSPFLRTTYFDDRPKLAQKHYFNPLFQLWQKYRVIFQRLFWCFISRFFFLAIFGFNSVVLATRKKSEFLGIWIWDLIIQFHSRLTRKKLSFAGHSVH